MDGCRGPKAGPTAPVPYQQPHRYAPMGQPTNTPAILALVQRTRPEPSRPGSPSVTEVAAPGAKQHAAGCPDSLTSPAGERKGYRGR
jgi:hypothetical protein